MHPHYEKLIIKKKISFMYWVKLLVESLKTAIKNLLTVPNVYE